MSFQKHAICTERKAEKRNENEVLPHTPFPIKKRIKKKRKKTTTTKRASARKQRTFRHVATSSAARDFEHGPCRPLAWARMISAASGMPKDPCSRYANRLLIAKRCVAFSVSSS